MSFLHAHIHLGDFLRPPKQILTLSILVLGQICSQELCLFVPIALGPPKAGPFIRVSELLQSSQSSIYFHGPCRAFAFSIVFL